MEDTSVNNDGSTIGSVTDIPTKMSKKALRKLLDEKEALILQLQGDVAYWKYITRRLTDLNDIGHDDVDTYYEKQMIIKNTYIDFLEDEVLRYALNTTQADHISTEQRSIITSTMIDIKTWDISRLEHALHTMRKLETVVLTSVNNNCMIQKDEIIKELIKAIVVTNNYIYNLEIFIEDIKKAVMKTLQDLEQNRRLTIESIIMKIRTLGDVFQQKEGSEIENLLWKMIMDQNWYRDEKTRSTINSQQHTEQSRETEDGKDAKHEMREKILEYIVVLEQKFGQLERYIKEIDYESRKLQQEIKKRDKSIHNLRTILKRRVKKDKNIRVSSSQIESNQNKESTAAEISFNVDDDYIPYSSKKEIQKMLTVIERRTNNLTLCIDRGDKTIKKDKLDIFKLNYQLRELEQENKKLEKNVKKCREQVKAQIKFKNDLFYKNIDKIETKKLCETLAAKEDMIQILKINLDEKDKNSKKLELEITGLKEMVEYKLWKMRHEIKRLNEENLKFTQSNLKVVKCIVCNDLNKQQLTDLFTTMIEMIIKMQETNYKLSIDEKTANITLLEYLIKNMKETHEKGGHSEEMQINNLEEQMNNMKAEREQLKQMIINLTSHNGTLKNLENMLKSYSSETDSDSDSINFEINKDNDIKSNVNVASKHSSRTSSDIDKDVMETMPTPFTYEN